MNNQVAPLVSQLPKTFSEPTLQSVIIERIRAGATLEETREYYRFLREIEADEAAKAAAADFVAMQAKLPPIPRRGKAHNYDYARWEDINELIKPVLTEFNWGLHFETITENDVGIEIKAILTHKSGHIRTNCKKLPLDKSGVKNIVQAFGSTQSYAQRYAAIPLLNIVSYGEDDDGQAGGKVRSTAQALQDGPHDAPSADDPDCIPPPDKGVHEQPKMMQKPISEQLNQEFMRIETVADLTHWKDLATVRNRIGQLREDWRKSWQGRVKTRFNELRTAAEMAALEHDRDAEYAKYYEDPAANEPDHL